MSETEYISSTSAIVQMVDNMMMNQDLEWTQEHKEHMPPGHFRREFQTVRVSLPRRSGHSTAAATLWKKYKTITVFPKHDWMMHFMRNIRHINRQDFRTHRCVSIYSYNDVDSFFRNIKGVTLDAEMVVFDGASRMGYDSVPPWRDVDEALTRLWERGCNLYELSQFVKQVYSDTVPWEAIVQRFMEEISVHNPSIRGVVILQ